MKWTLRLGIALLFCGVFFAQTTPPATEQKPEAPATSPDQKQQQITLETPTQLIEKVAAARRKANQSPPGAVEIISDTMGVDFGPYLQGVLKTVRQNWYNVIPQAARPPIMKKGKVAIEFAILKDGSLSGLQRVASSGDVTLDRAAWGGITACNPFPPLPSQFGGQYLALRFYFYYNCKGEDCPSETTKDYGPTVPAGSPSLARAADLQVWPSSAEVAEGARQQFHSTSAEKSLVVLVNWSVVGTGCVEQACGTISRTGLYTAPHGAPNPPTVTVTATLAANPSKKASAAVTIVQANPR